MSSTQKSNPSRFKEETSASSDPGQDGLAGSAHSGFAPDVFGEALDYYPNDYTRSSQIAQRPQGDYSSYSFDGKLASQRWRTSGLSNGTTGSTQLQAIYDFSYDPRNQLEGSYYGTFNSSVTSNNTSLSARWMCPLPHARSHTKVE